MGLSIKKKRERWAMRLRTLATYLNVVIRAAENMAKVQFNMGAWATRVKPRPELTCGTSACAGGFATNIFSKSGLILVKENPESKFFDIRDVNNKTSSFDACKSFFGCTKPFDPVHYEDMYGKETEQITLSDVVNELNMYASKIERGEC